MFGPKGCDVCRHLGYSGRTGVFEVLKLTPKLRQMIVEKAPTATLYQQALGDGLMPCRLAALLKVARGETSIEEVFRAIPPELLATEA